MIYKRQKEILTKSLKLEQGGSVAIAKEIIETNDKIEDIKGNILNIESNVDEKLNGLSEIVSNSESKVDEKISQIDEDKIVERVKNSIPTPKDGKDYVLTKQDKSEIAKSINVPIVEKVIEKTEVIKEIQNQETAIETRDKLESLIDEDRLDKSAIKGLEDYEEISKLAKEPRKVENNYSGGGVRKFINLLDTPDSYTGQSGKAVTVKTDESGVEFSTITSGDRYRTTSATSQTIVSTGTLTFTVDSGLAYTVLQDVIIVYDTSNYMHAEVVSYSGTTLVVDIKDKTGSGTYSSWIINLDAVPIDAITGTGTTNELAYFTSGSVISSLSTSTYPSLTELSYVKGVTSSIQTQLNGKQAIGTYVTGATDSTLTLTGTTLGLNLANANTWTAKQTIELTTTQASWNYNANNKTDITVDSVGSAIFSAQNNTSTANYLKFRTQTLNTGEYLQLGVGSNGTQARLKHSTGNALSYIDFISNNNRININGCDITSPFFVGSQYLPDPWLGAYGSSGGQNSIRTYVSGTGTGKTINFYTQTYATNGGHPKLQISGNGLDLGIKDGSPVWNDVLDNITLSINASTGKVSVGLFGTTTPASATARLDIISSTATEIGLIVKGATSQSGNLTEWRNSSGTALTLIDSAGNLQFNANNIITDTTTGTKIGTSTLQKLSLWNATPIVQPTTAVGASTLVSNGGTTLTDTDTFDGYTRKQVVRALRNIGLLV